MSAYTLAHSTQPVSAPATEWDERAVTGHPPVTARMVGALWWWLTDDTWQSGDPVTWWDRSGLEWHAVTDLLRAGRTDDALALAGLLRWCEAQPRRPGERGFWQVVQS